VEERRIETRQEKLRKGLILQRIAKQRVSAKGLQLNQGWKMERLCESWPESGSSSQRRPSAFELQPERAIAASAKSIDFYILRMGITSTD
jgi:hypothetical protein